uniref:CG12772 n=3 Tax=Macrostomum lignano TaxID=282301 RepID=A0A1I8GJ61_9PLAT
SKLCLQDSATRSMIRQHQADSNMSAEADADSGLGTPTTSNSLIADSPTASPSPRSSILTGRGDDDFIDEFEMEFDEQHRRHRRILQACCGKQLPDVEEDRTQEKQPQKQPQPLQSRATRLSRPAMAAASVPMRCRHLPPSIWIEPNVPMYSPALPPLDLAGHLPKSLAAAGKSSSNCKSPTSTAAPAGSSTVLVCSAFDSEDSLRRLFDVAPVRGGGGGSSTSSVAAARQLGAAFNHNDCLTAAATTAVPPPASIRRRFVCGRDPRLSDNSICGRRLPPLDLAGGGATATAGLSVANNSSAAQLLGEVASLL